MRFQVFTAMRMKTTPFWDILPCSLIGVDQCFRGVYCLHHHLFTSLGMSVQITPQIIVKCVRKYLPLSNSLPVLYFWIVFESYTMQTSVIFHFLLLSLSSDIWTSPINGTQQSSFCLLIETHSSHKNVFNSVRMMDAQERYYWNQNTNCLQKFPLIL
jgi:hypothetical protein